MSVLALRAGIRVAERYRLERPIRDVGTSPEPALWQGTDEALARPVALRIVPAAGGRAARLLDAARAAGRVSSPRLASVLDATEVDGVVVVVSEWLAGEPLREVLHDGPLPPAEAARVLAGVAAAIADAHRAGLAHGALTADSVILAATGPRLAGLGLDAALVGIEPEPAADIRALGTLLFAALTGRAPSGIPPSRDARCGIGAGGPGALPPSPVDPLPGLPAAPTAAGRGFTARQVRGGVPADLDILAEHALGRLTATPTAYELALALGAAADRADQPAARPMARWLIPLCVLALVLGAGWLATGAPGRTPGGLPLPTRPTATAAAPAPSPRDPGQDRRAAYRPEAVHDFDPYGDGSESPGAVRLAFDGDPATAWTTSLYRSRPDFGGLKPGVGLLVDLGAARTVAAVDVVVRGGPTDVELRTGNRAADRADAFDVVASAPEATGAITLRPSRPRGRFWLLWLTRLPPAGDGYRGELADFAFRP